MKTAHDKRYLLSTAGVMRGYGLFHGAMTTWMILPLLISDTASLQVPNSTSGYDESFFQQHMTQEPAYASLARILYQIAGSPSSAVDIGCGHGLVVEGFRRLGVQDSYCVEGSADAAKNMWPLEYREHYYRKQDLAVDFDATTVVPKTDIVTSFEVAEHLPSTRAQHFVRVLTVHRPRMIFFGAATVNQDRGLNPSHVNENTFQYWINHFAMESYVVDFVATARARRALLQDTVLLQHFNQVWWYPKNIFVFVDQSAQNDLDKDLVRNAGPANMKGDFYLNFGYDIGLGQEFGDFWKRDWEDFAGLFYSAYERALQRINKEL